MNNLYEQIVQRLKEYYGTEGIVPGDHFSCKYYKDGHCPGDLARGMQCHVGSKYGDRMKILIASLDCGNGGANIIEGRTYDVVDSSKHPLNPHMRGTYKALSYFLDETDPEQLAHYMIMTNTCKCCYWDSPNHLGIQYYLNCGAFSIEEIKIIKPEVILFQGKNATAYSLANSLLSPIEDLHIDDAVDINEYIRLFRTDGFKCYAVICIHPSARGRHARKRVEFYNEKLPVIAKYIKAHPLSGE